MDKEDNFVEFILINSIITQSIKGWVFFMSHQKKEVSNILKNFNSGKKKEALTNITTLIKNNPNELDYLFLYGKMCSEVNKLNEAENTFLLLLSKNKNSIEYLKNLYVIYLKKNNLVKAEKYIKKILEIDSGHYNALRDFGYIKYLNNNLEEAEKIFKKILNKINHDVFALNIYGLINYHNGQLDIAISKFISAIKLKPEYIDSYNNLGKLYFDLEDLDKAFSRFKKAYKLNKNFYKTLINIGNILSLKDKNNYAIKAYKKALSLTNNKGDILSNISIAYSRIKDFDNTIKYYNEAIKYNNNNSTLNLSLSYLYLYKNKFLEAWDLFDYRIETGKFFKKKYNLDTISYILKRKKDFNKNEKVLVLREQGIGEEILFSSLYSDLIRYSDNVTIESDPRLISIFERSFNKKIFVEDGKFSKDIKGLKNFEVIIFAGSLCRKFRKEKNFFPKIDYLLSNQEKDFELSQSSVFKKNKLNVGLSWKSVVSIYGKLKSLNLIDFKQIFKKNRQIINLQYGDTKSDIKEIEKENCKIYSFDKINLFNDLDGCMSILKNIDVFVTVSNSTAHIAAAMGIKTILICPKKSSTYFYWSNEDTSTPWYRDVTILTIDKSIKVTINKVDKILEKI